MSRLLLVLLALLLSSPLVPARAQTAPGAEATAASVEAEDAPVMVPEPSEEAVSYYRSGNVLWVVRTLWGLLVMGVILFSGFSARMRDWARGAGRNWFFTLVAYAAIFSLITWLIDLPLTYYAGFVRPHAYDLSNQTFGKWLGDEVKGLLLGVVGLSLVLWVPYLLLKKSPRRWWLYSSLAVIPGIVFLLLITPVWVEPLFNDFGRLEDQELEVEILALAERAGVEGSRVYQVDKSVDTEAVNAYVTGFGGTKRIVLWDTLLEKLDRDEVLFVMGHEIGHYALGHTWWLIGLAVVGTLVSLYAVHLLSGWLIARFGRRFGFERMSDIASFPLLILIVSLVSLVVAPIGNAVTRHFEHEADRFALEITRANRPAALAFLKLQEENLAVPYPGPVYKLWRMSHPPIGERIEFANTYRPWEAGEPLRYGELFGEAP